MSNTKQQDGGPAFPCQIDNDGGWYHPEANDMSLRDWFAGQALAMLPHLGETALSPQEWAHEAYAMADAMLKAREVKP